MGPRPTLMATQPHGLHSQMKRSMANTFSNGTMLGLEEFIDNFSMEFIGALDEFAKKGEPIDLGLWFHFYALDVM